MDLKMVQKILDINWYIKDLAYRIGNYKYNREIIKFTKRVSKIDSIANFSAFCNEMERVPQSPFGSTLNIKRVFGENTLYGYATQIMSYAGIDQREIINFPLVEHGVPYGKDFDNERHKQNTSYIFQGRYAEQEWNKHREKDRAYFIGPYIHYCDGYYDKYQIAKIKQMIGKTVLLFLPHSCEGQETEIDIKRIIERNNNSIDENSKVDTYLVCVYCCDTWRIRDVALPRNIKFVSAGFKTDELFVKRLRTILEISDVIIFNSFSSSIGYAYYLGKRIIADVTDEDIMESYKQYGKAEGDKIKLFKELFANDNVKTEQDRREFVEKYWGLSEIKSKDEIMQIYQECKKRRIRRLGF